MTQREIELKEQINEMCDAVRGYLNSYRTPKNDKELGCAFDIFKCQSCQENWEYKDDMVYHKYDIGEVESKICKDCRNNE